MHWVVCVAIAALARFVAGEVEVELNSGKKITVQNENEITDTIQGDKGNPAHLKVAPRDLFGRAFCSAKGQNIICGNSCCPNDQLCCEYTSCVDVSQKLCCRGGTQCPRNGDCCSDGNCCAAGRYCVLNLRSGARGCLRYGSNGEDVSTIQGSAQATGAGAGPAGTTPAPTGPPAPSLSAAASTFTCDNAGYKPCPDQKFCCPSGEYCFYNRLGSPRCWADEYYTFYYYYSWSFSFGYRYYTTRTSFYLGGSGATVPAITTPPAPTTPPPSTSGLQLSYTPPSLSSFSFTPISLPTPSLDGGNLPTGAQASSASSPSGGNPFGLPVGGGKGPDGQAGDSSQPPPPTQTPQSGGGSSSGGDGGDGGGGNASAAAPTLLTPGMLVGVVTAGLTLLLSLAL